MMEHHEYLVLGAGPAGLQASFFLKQNGRDYLVLERGGQAGTFFATFPRHRKLISINKVYTGHDDPELNLRWDWNSLLSNHEGPLFKDFSQNYFPHADTMGAYLAEFTRQHALQVQYGVDVTRIQRNGHFELTTAEGKTYTCDKLIVATGVSRENTPDIPGVELADRYGAIDLDTTAFRNKRVLILGKGNSAFETADHLMESAALLHLVSPRPIRMAWRTHFVGDLRAVNNNLLDTYQLKMQNAVLDANVLGINRVGDQYEVTFQYSHAGGEVETLRYDRVILCTGFKFDNTLFDEACRPAMTVCRRFPMQTSEWESVNVPGLFFAGTIMQMRDLKKYMSGFIHGFRYNIRALSRLLEARYHGKPWPISRTVSGPEEITQWLLDRINGTSSLWQQPGFLCDVLELTGPERGVGREEFPVDYTREHLARQGAELLVLTLEFGQSAGADPFASERIHRADVNRAKESAFLHPIIRHFVDGRVVAEHHIIEDLAAEWREPEHLEPLREFIQKVLQRAVPPSLPIPRPAAALSY
ncbi:NAD(P)-binding domain-containing protein [Comamonas sp. JC664]|uniref:NAD(P)-binding domain-containing protein n=1 Tax=Comamonas sp. JC664 TaxID=2801917 RepID=UPI00174BB769|nr:NAD(P)-binding domain-containing protein [Comamonas sp. JC664]MBL0696309.1 NAD(P)-binding domain-containing protein [Comamonas sp. JC664]GHG66400.1 pyridine nucleotide-disulfide oxidoreductase [Comamonas sp. KCTC 72670]